MVEEIKLILSRSIQLADQVTKVADEAAICKQECVKIKAKTMKLAWLLHQAAQVSSYLYERPVMRIINDTMQALDKALSLVLKCNGKDIKKRVLLIIPMSAFRKSFAQLESSIENVWLLRASGFAEDCSDDYLGLPLIAVNEPILGLIWKQIAILSTGSLENRSGAAASLVLLAKDNKRYGKLIVKEGGVGALLKLLEEGKVEGQEIAANAIGFLGCDPENVEAMIQAGVCPVFVKILKEGPMKVQAAVAWAVSELIACYPKCQDLFEKHCIVRTLVSHLAFEPVQEHTKYNITANKATSIHAAVLTSNPGMNNVYKHDACVQPLYLHDAHSSASMKTKMRAMSAKALWQLAKGNLTICRRITESRAVLCFALLIEKGEQNERHNSTMALMEITAMAEQDPSLRRSAFKPTSPACQAVVDQLLKIIEKKDADLLIQCIKSIGHLARTFPASDKRMISPLVQLLDVRETEVSKEACIALTKFARTENFLHTNHCEQILAAGGATQLVQLVYFGEQSVQIAALNLICYLALHLPRVEVLPVIEWASEKSHLTQDEALQTLLHDARSKLELFQPRRP